MRLGSFMDHMVRSSKAPVKAEPPEDNSWVFETLDPEVADDQQYEHCLHMVERIIEEIELPNNFMVHLNEFDHEGHWYIQISCTRPDTYTGEMGVGYGGKAFLSGHESESQIVQTIWGLYQSYVLHEAREGFKWRGRRVFGPHMDINALWEVAERFDPGKRR